MVKTPSRQPRMTLAFLDCFFLSGMTVYRSLGASLLFGSRGGHPRQLFGRLPATIRNKDRSKRSGCDDSSGVCQEKAPLRKREEWKDGRMEEWKDGRMEDWKWVRAKLVVGIIFRPDASPPNGKGVQRSQTRYDVGEPSRFAF